MKLTVAEQRAVAQRGQWYFDCYFGCNTGDSVVFTGDRVADLDRLVSILANGTARDARFVCDVSTGNYSVYRPFDLDDVQAIRGFFAGWYGSVSKINAYDRR